MGLFIILLKQLLHAISSQGHAKLSGLCPIPGFVLQKVLCKGSHGTNRHPALRNIGRISYLPIESTAPNHREFDKKYSVN
jgi:hypothetical protein